MIVLQLIGCAAISMRSPKSKDPRMTPRCSESRGGVFLDGLFIAAYGLASLAIISNNTDTPQLAIPTLALGGAHVASAVAGHRSAKRCTNAIEAHETWFAQNTIRAAEDRSRVEFSREKVRQRASDERIEAAKHRGKLRAQQARRKAEQAGVKREKPPMSTPKQAEGRAPEPADMQEAAPERSSELRPRKKSPQAKASKPKPVDKSTPGRGQEKSDREQKKPERAPSKPIPDEAEPPETPRQPAPDAEHKPEPKQPDNDPPWADFWREKNP